MSGVRIKSSIWSAERVLTDLVLGRIPTFALSSKDGFTATAMTATRRALAYLGCCLVWLAVSPVLAQGKSVSPGGASSARKHVALVTRKHADQRI